MPEIITRAEARKQKPMLPRYYLGTPCANGHIAELVTETAQCVECIKMRTAKSDAKKTAEKAAAKAAITPEQRREAFCRAYVQNGGRLQQSAVSAGYPAASASVRANELMKRDDILRRIDELLRERFVVEGQKAHETILKLSKKSSPADAVKLRAAKELMVLGGMFRKADAASHAADASKREFQSQAEGYALLARAVAELLTVPGISTGITFDATTGKVTVTNADHASAFLTNLYHGFTTKRPAPSVRSTPVVDEPPDEPEDEDEEEWVAT
jgi:hypothetical protein